ncbi:MAG: SIS domain-containing protein [Patescibacteria group bacterium]
MIFKDFFQSYTSGLLFVLAKTQLTGADGESQDVMSSLGDLAERFKAAHDAGGKLILVGNGGSAAICSHQAFDYWKNGNIRAMSLNDPSLLTGSANDFGYPDVFAKPIEMFANPQDVIIAISSSGQSPNILNAARAGKAKGCAIVTMSAFKSDNPLRNLGDVNIYLDTMMYGYAELGHETILHTILDYHISGRHA